MEKSRNKITIFSFANPVFISQAGLELVDRAGFEPAAFRFLSQMRTGRSLALIQAYQAELPAPAV